MSTNDTYNVTPAVTATIEIIAASAAMVVAFGVTADPSSPEAEDQVGAALAEIHARLDRGEDTEEFPEFLEQLDTLEQLDALVSAAQRDLAAAMREAVVGDIDADAWVVQYATALEAAAAADARTAGLTLQIDEQKERIAEGLKALRALV